MQRNFLWTSVLTCVASAVLLGTAFHAHAQDVKTPYPNMAPLDQYLMEQNAEAALARCAALESISRDAEIMALGRHGYETVAKGKNGFVCMVLRSWTSGINEPEFWNPKIRSAICFNPAAARTYLPIIIKKTDLVLAGQSKTQMVEGIKTGFGKKELPALESGAMCYMMSKQSYLNDRDVHWHPHLMFFVPQTEHAAWGANLPRSPIFAADEMESHLTVFLIPVGSWSDGTPGPSDGH